MTTSEMDPRIQSSRMPALGMLTLALLMVAALLNGVGSVGVTAGPDEGNGRFTPLKELTATEKIPFDRIDRALARLPLTEEGDIEIFEAFEPALASLTDELIITSPDAEVRLQRAHLLIDRSLPPKAAVQLTDALPEYLQYQRVERLLKVSRVTPLATLEGAYVELLTQDALRRVALGPERADQLYQNTFGMTEMHLARQLLMQRDDLSREQKQELMEQQSDALAGPDDEESARDQ